MTEYIISLRPSMKKRLDFDHPLMDKVGKGFYDLKPEQVEPILQYYLEHRNPDDAEILRMCYMWVVRDLVCRFRAHWYETIPMTDDLVSVGLLALTEIIENYNGNAEEKNLFKSLQTFIHERMRTYINDNRCTFGASAKTNNRRKKADEPLEYNFAIELNDEIVGEIDEPYLIDILDSIEALNEVDAEEMRDLVLKFLKQNHNISEEELTPEERESLEKLTELVRNAGV